MSDGKDSMRSIITVAVSVCFVCAVFVSATSVSLKPQQRLNKELDRNKNVLVAAGLFEEDVTSLSEIPQLFERIETRVVDFQEGRVLSEEEAAAVGIDPARYDQRKAAKDAARLDELRKTNVKLQVDARVNSRLVARQNQGLRKQLSLVAVRTTHVRYKLVAFLGWRFVVRWRKSEDTGVEQARGRTYLSPLPCPEAHMPHS